ncbi:viroplasmin family protein [Candidatus Galacturonibacter soehngenii]|uniref:Reverse transcriptase-like protein n=1 Tax=Candidatus Galacturonatibacter soehngenii TaxID=2307010 RepID=A0A7V7UD90_9FIRM|nr:ribonuclease H family protein [Candidatus Galacturonibacter soehngenii]KAB1440106.1 reverse transcriptase-like protein [Candidatus Galacturonibacter soehngenii]MBA4686061.1 viroplasmin family protein [Candidatus Galacturonibacter soehngenii]
MGKKVYAIKEGLDPVKNEIIENKIVATWDECLKYVKGVKGAKYKSFENIESANQYLRDGKILKKGEGNYPEDCLHIYVDGSFNSATERYSYGMVAVRNNIIEYIEGSSSEDNSMKDIRQIAGELKGSIRGIQYALDKGEKKVVLFYDYEGVAHHATGFWERREPSSIEYYNQVNDLMNKGIEVIFVKIDSHTGDLFNELADEVCKERLSISSSKVVEKWLASNVIYVDNLEIKKEIIKIAPKYESNIIIIENNKTDNYVSEVSGLKYSNIIKIYEENHEEGINLINKLSEYEKNNFIIYLLKNKK